MSNFICIQFGNTGDSNRWYNEFTNHSSARSAKRYGIESMCIAGQFGYVIIEEGEDFWDVIDEIGAPSNLVSISCTRLGTFSVQPAPQLVLNK